VLAERDGSSITNYLWRHVAASDLLMSGVDVATVAELLGTSAAQIQRTYGHLLEDHLAAASERLGRRR
jgi:site-specific recombinase XerD